MAGMAGAGITGVAPAIVIDRTTIIMVTITTTAMVTVIVQLVSAGVDTKCRRQGDAGKTAREGTAKTASHHLRQVRMPRVAFAPSRGMVRGSCLCAAHAPFVP